jgi:DNA polymerase delta subunit 1
VLEKYNRANGYEFDSKVIYGDTDSVMVKFGVSDRARAMALGKEAAEYVSTLFKKPIKLEFEKIYHPYLLMNKKRYAGMYWTNLEKPDKMDAKGIETVRRDNCELVSKIVQGALDKMLIEMDDQAALEYCRGLISDLLLNRIDLSLLVITKGLTKKSASDDPDEDKKKQTQTYANKQAHATLADKMKQRDAASAPTLGDRVAYVMVKGTKGSKGYEKSEDPIFVLENNLPIDYEWYISNQIKQPLLRIFHPLFYGKARQSFQQFGKEQAALNAELAKKVDDYAEKLAEEQLFKGEHMKHIYHPKANTKVGLGKFTVVQAECVNCKRVLPPKHPDIICQFCEEKRQEIFIQKRLEQNQAEKAYSDLWVQCQRCQGSLHQDILCSSKECPIFYKRVKAKKNLEELADQLVKFEEW